MGSFHVHEFGHDFEENSPVIHLETDGLWKNVNPRIEALGADDEVATTMFVIYSEYATINGMEKSIEYRARPEKAQLQWLDSAIDAREYILDFGGVTNTRDLSSSDRTRLMRARVALTDALEELKEQHEGGKL